MTILSTLVSGSALFATSWVIFTVAFVFGPTLIAFHIILAVLLLAMLGMFVGVRTAHATLK